MSSEPTATTWPEDTTEYSWGETALCRYCHEPIHRYSPVTQPGLSWYPSTEWQHQRDGWCRRPLPSLRRAGQPDGLGQDRNYVGAVVGPGGNVTSVVHSTYDPDSTEWSVVLVEERSPADAVAYVPGAFGEPGEWLTLDQVRERWGYEPGVTDTADCIPPDVVKWWF